MGAYACGPSNQKAKGEELLQVQGQAGLQQEIFSKHSKPPISPQQNQMTK